jgi:ketosteroid isomerase-like protein
MTPTHNLIAHFLHALFPYDRAALSEMLTDDVVWHTPQSALPAFREAQRGKQAVLHMMTGGDKSPYVRETRRAETQFIMAEGDFAAIQFRLKARATSGRDYDNLYCLTFRLRDGRICEAWEHLDTAYLYATIGMSLDEVRND